MLSSNAQDNPPIHRHRRKRGKGRPAGLSGKTRFRAAVRMVLHNRSWLADGEAGDRGDDNVDDVIKKNVLRIDLITREKYQSLTLENKCLLRKDARLRREEDIENLYKILGNLKGFRRYPENVRKELVASTYFEYYEPGRVILRQGHESTLMGFVLTGDLEVTVAREDPVFGETVTEVVGRLQSGVTFGDVSLLHGIRRTATVTTTTAAELLILKKDDFDRVLKASMQKQWDEISTALKQFPYFDSWSDVAVRECCMLSDTMTFTSQEVIIGRGIGKTASAHFVLSGTCSVVQRLAVKRDTSQPGGFALVPRAQRQAKQAESVQPLFMQVCLFNQGGCFNLGESLQDRTVVAADNDVTVLRIPLYLLRQHNVANIWSRIRQFLESRLCSEEQLFTRFLEARRWDRYKKDLCSTLRNPETLNDTSIHDAPYYWRVLDMEMCDGKPCKDS